MVNILLNQSEEENKPYSPSTNILNSQSSTLSQTSKEEQNKFLNSLDDSQYQKMVDYHKQGYSFDQAKNMLDSDKKEQQKYLDSLDDAQYNKMLDYYNQGYSFEDAQNMLINGTSTTGKALKGKTIGGGRRGLINPKETGQARYNITKQDSSTAGDVLDYANIPGAFTEMLDNQVQKIPNFNIQDRRSELQKQVDSLSKEQKADYKKERESFDTATQSYFGSLNKYMLSQEAGVLDSIFETWREDEESKDDFNIKNTIGNIPGSLIKTASAITRAVTNPVDTLEGLGTLGADTLEGMFGDKKFQDTVIGHEYFTAEGWKNSLQNDPVGRVSDVVGAFAGGAGIAKGIVSGTARAGAKLGADAGKLARLSKTAGKLGRVQNVLDNISDLGITNLYKGEGGLLDKVTGKLAQGNKLSRTAGSVLELSQRPLKTIWKGTSKYELKDNDGNTIEQQSIKGVHNLVEKVIEHGKEKYKDFASGLTAEKRQRIQQNPYIKPLRDETVKKLESEGASFNDQVVVEKMFQDLGDELIKRIDKYEQQLSDTGEGYEALKNNPATFNLSKAVADIRQLLFEEGIKTNSKGKLESSKYHTPEELNALNLVWDFIQKARLYNTNFRNYHDLRRGIDKLAKYDKGGSAQNVKLIQKVRSMIDNEAKKQIPGLKEIDDTYSKEIRELNKIKEGLVYRQGDRKGTYRDNFMSILKNIGGQNRQVMKGRLEERIFPGIGEQVEAINMIPELVKSYQGSPALMKVFGKIIGAGGGFGTSFIRGALSFLLGSLADELIIRPLGEKMRKKVIDNLMKEMTPEAQQKLADIESKRQAGIELTEEDKKVLEMGLNKIAQAVKLETEIKPKIDKEVEKKKKIDEEENKKKAEETWKKQEEEKKKVQEEMDSFLNEREKELETIKDQEVDYSQLSDETLNKLREDDTIPQAEKEKIENILMDRMNNEITRDAQKGQAKTTAFTKTDAEFIRRAHQLQEMEQNIGKVGKNKVGAEAKEKQRKHREDQRDKLIQEIKEAYKLDQYEAHDKYDQFVNAGIDEEYLTKRGGRQTADKKAEKEIIDKLNMKKEQRNKQPAFLKGFSQKALDTREYYHTHLDGYEIQAVDKGDRIVKNGETVGNITYKQDGTIDSVIVKDLGNFIKQKKLLQDLPADTQIRVATDKNSISAKDLREIEGIQEPKYQKAYHGSQYDFDKFTMGGNVGKSNGLKYGYGHYVTFDKKLARGYADKTYTYEGDKNFSDNRIEQAKFKTVIETMEDMLTEGKDFETVKETMIQRLRQGHISDSITQRVEQMKESDFEKRSRNFYEIEIPDEKKADTPTGKNYLEDTIISTKEIKKFQETIEKEYPGKGKIFKKNMDENYSDGSGLYDALSNTLGGGIEGQKMASEFLNKIGYDGLKYNDGWENAVLFTDEAMQIVNHEMYQRYGVANQNEKDIKAQKGLSMENFKNGRTVEQIAKDYGIETNIVDRIATPEGEKALGMYADGLITLAKDIKEGTAPHELLHAVFDLVDDKRKKQVLELVKKKLGREGGLENSKDKNLDAEEWLADKFSEYFRTGKFEERGRPKGMWNKIKEFFSRVKDFITGVYKEKKTIKNLFDDIIENRIEHDMVNELLKNEADTSVANKSQNLYQTSSLRKVHINDENSSQYLEKLSDLKNKIDNGEIAPSELLPELKKILGDTGNDSEYVKVHAPNGTHILRVSDHYANSRNQKGHKYRNLSLVLKDITDTYRPDGITKDRFSGSEKIGMNEYVYDTKNMNTAKIHEILDGIQQLINDGHYTSINADLVHRTKLAPAKYQVTQKSLFDDDLIQEQPKATKDIKKESEQWLKKTREEDEDGNMRGYLNNISTDKDFYIKDRYYKDKGAEIHQHLMDFFNNHTFEEIEKYVNKKDSGFNHSEADMILKTKQYLDGDNLTVNDKLKNASYPLREGVFKQLYGGTKENAKRNHTIETESSENLLNQIDRIKDVYKHALKKRVEIGHRFDKRKYPIENLIENEKINLEKEKEMKPYFDKIDDSFKHLGEYYLNHLKSVMEDYNGDMLDWKFELKKSGYTAEEIKKMHLDDLTDYIRNFFKDKDLNDYSDVMTETEKKFIQRVLNKDFAPDVETAKEIRNIFNKYSNTLDAINTKFTEYYQGTTLTEYRGQMEKLYGIIGETYDPDVEKRQKNIYKKMGEFEDESALEKTSNGRKNVQQETVDTQDLTSLKSMFKELEQYEKYNEWIQSEPVPGPTKSFDPKGIYQDYLKAKDNTPQKKKETVQKLVAISNMTEDKFKQIIKDNGKIPMPSIAVMNPDIHHVDFGEIQMVFGKDTVDPKANKDNVIYGTDAYTPAFGNLYSSIITKNGGTFIKGIEFKDGKDRPLTPENLLKAMKEGQPAVRRDVKPGSYKDMIQINGSKIDDIEDVRKKNFGDFRFHEIEDQIQNLNEKYNEQVSNLEEEWNYRGKNIRKDIKKAYDPDAKKFAENLNQNGDAYGTVSEETTQGLIDTIEKGRQSSIRFSESKPQRIVNAYDEVQHILVPTQMIGKIRGLVKGTPLEDKIQGYASQGGEDRKDTARTKKLHALQKKYGNVFFSMGGIVMPIAYLLQMINGENEEGQEG